jgi:hypothetical protein
VLFLCHCLKSKRYSPNKRYYLREADVHRTLSLSPVHDKETVGVHESSYDVETETMPQKKEPTLTLKRVHSGLSKIRHGSIKILKKVGNKIKAQIYESKKRRCVNNSIFGNRINRNNSMFCDQTTPVTSQRQKSTLRHHSEREFDSKGHAYSYEEQNHHDAWNYSGDQHNYHDGSDYCSETHQPKHDVYTLHKRSEIMEHNVALGLEVAEYCDKIGFSPGKVILFDCTCLFVSEYNSHPFGHFYSLLRFLATIFKMKNTCCSE